MKVRTNRELATGGVTDSTSFDLSHDDAAHIMTILRDTLYSDRILAVLREYSSNAWDAHRMAGKPDLPIKVVLPTLTEPKLVIRDYGPGLSQDDVFNVYTKYGKSTKRDTDSAVGMLGIGSKSGFAYSDSFTVTSWHGGFKSMYVAVLDESDKGTMNLLAREPCDGETGIEIQVAIEQGDISEFEDRAEDLFKHFQPRPDINTELPELPETQAKLTHGYMYLNREINYGDQGWVAVMGCVPYKIDISQVRDTKPGIGDNAYGLSGVMNFDIGDVSINASREGLKYDDNTKLAIVTKVNALIDEYVADRLKFLDEKANDWERRIGAEGLRQLNLPALDKFLKAKTVRLQDDKDEPKLFYTSGPADTKEASSIPITEHTRLLIHDISRSLGGYNLHKDVRIVRRRSATNSYKEVREELDKFAKAAGITGVTIGLLSDEPWEKIRAERSVGGSNKKHDRKVFQLKPKAYFRHPWSSDWEIAGDHEASESDVFVILERFQAVGESGFGRNMINSDKRLCQFFKVDFPAILGYKTTERKPLKAENIPGQTYIQWRTELYKRLMSGRTGKRLLALYYWEQTDDVGVRHWRSEEKERFKAVPGFLGADHPILVWIEDRKKAVKIWADVDGLARNAIRTLAGETTGEGEAIQRYDALKAAYPLMLAREYGCGLNNLWEDEDDAQHWVDYVKLVDRAQALENKENGNDHSAHDHKRIHQRDAQGGDSDDSQKRPKLRAIAGGAGS